MRTFTAVAECDDGWWVIQVEGVGVTQARHRGEVQSMAEGLVACLLQLDPDEFTVELRLVTQSGYLQPGRLARGLFAIGRWLRLRS